MNWPRTLGDRGMPPKPLPQWSTLGSGYWACTAYPPGASPTTPPRPGCWNVWAFDRKGRLRQNEYFKGRWWDTLLYALLRDEWENLELYQELDREPLL